jgi:hypothetical protein
MPVSVPSPMSKSHLILRYSIATLSAVVLTGPLLRAATVDNFETGSTRTPSVATQLRSGPGPVVVQDGTNSFLRLLDGVNDENNQYSYDLSDAGAFETIIASFDFRITPGTDPLRLADGLGFLLLPTSSFGVTGAGPAPTAEEPNVAGAFGLGVDVYPGINNSFHSLEWFSGG